MTRASFHVGDEVVPAKHPQHRMRITALRDTPHGSVALFGEPPGSAGAWSLVDLRAYTPRESRAVFRSRDAAHAAAFTLVVIAFAAGFALSAMFAPYRWYGDDLFASFVGVPILVIIAHLMRNEDGGYSFASTLILSFFSGAAIYVMARSSTAILSAFSVQ